MNITQAQRRAAVAHTLTQLAPTYDVQCFCKCVSVITYSAVLYVCLLHFYAVFTPGVGHLHLATYRSGISDPAPAIRE
jgi:hypothetical protein